MVYWWFSGIPSKNPIVLSPHLPKPVIYLQNGHLWQFRRTVPFITRWHRHAHVLATPEFITFHGNCKQIAWEHTLLFVHRNRCRWTQLRWCYEIAFRTRDNSFKFYHYLFGMWTLTAFSHLEGWCLVINKYKK